MNRLHHLIFFLLLLPFCSAAQNHLYDTKAEIADRYKSLSDSGYTVDVLDTNGQLMILVSGFEDITQTYFFDIEGNCDSIVLQYNCIECFDQHLDLLIKRGPARGKWLKSSDQLYVASKWMSKSENEKHFFAYGVPVMTVNRSRADATIVTLYERSFSKPEWEALQKTARK